MSRPLDDILYEIASLEYVIRQLQGRHRELQELYRIEKKHYEETIQLCSRCGGLLEKERIMRGGKPWTCLKCQKEGQKERRRIGALRRYGK